MKLSDEHILSACNRYFGENNLIVVFRSKHLCELYDIDYIYAIVEDGRIQGIDNMLTADFLASVEATKNNLQITEICFGDAEYHIGIRAEDDILYQSVVDISQYKKDNIPQKQPRSDKGYYTINSQTSALLARRHDQYEECFENLRPRLDNLDDSMHGTCQMLFYMHDHLSEDIVLDWFMHESPFMLFLRHSSPFAHIASQVPQEEYLSTMHDVVNHPEKYPPRPDYDVWLRTTLEKPAIPEHMKRYIPDNLSRLSSC